MREIFIAGAGPAGAAAAISGRLEGSTVRTVDRTRTARHKVCGEFLSPGVQEILEQLCVWDQFASLGARPIRRCALHLANGTKCWALPERGWGLSRLELDRLLLNQAVSLGAAVERGTVFDLAGQACGAVVVACGRKPSSAQDDRLFGFKAHFEGPGDDAVELFFDARGYVGVSGIEGGVTNVSGIARESTLRKLGFDFDEVVRRSAPLAERLRPLERRMRWLVAGPLAFSPPGSGTRCAAVYEAGDSLSFVDPFTGSGIMNALLTGRLAGQAAARGTSPEQYRRECRSLLGVPFLISSMLRRLAAHAEWHHGARYLPGRLLFEWTRANMGRS
jgi:flavin-dependent dehydrogenase